MIGFAPLASLRGQRVVVLGSAPLDRPLVIADDERVVAVNGGVSSYPRCDVWVVNSRGAGGAIGPTKRNLSARMRAQARDRAVGDLVLVCKGDEAADAITLKALERQRTTWTSERRVAFTDRQAIERLAGGRTPELAAHALSLGLFAVSLVLWSGAARVRLEGFSWTYGYAYLLPSRDDRSRSRGHEYGDKVALARLVARHPGVLTHHLVLNGALPVTESHMSTKDTPTDAPATEPGPTGPAPAAAPAKPRLMKVQAIRMIYYQHRRRRPGDVFVIPVNRFNAKHMREVAADTPKKLTTAKDLAREQHQQVMSGARLQPNAVDLLDEDAPDPLRGELDEELDGGLDVIT